MGNDCRPWPKLLNVCHFYHGGRASATGQEQLTRGLTSTALTYDQPLSTVTVVSLSAVRCDCEASATSSNCSFKASRIILKVWRSPPLKALSATRFLPSVVLGPDQRWLARRSACRLQRLGTLHQLRQGLCAGLRPCSNASLYFRQSCRRFAASSRNEL